MTATPGDNRADRLAARATGVGIGLLAFMITWLVGARITEQIWGPPSSAVAAMAVAVVVGTMVALIAGGRLLRRQLSEGDAERPRHLEGVQGPSQHGARPKGFEPPTF